ncbi:MAG: hypothetical protein L3K15_08790, partial [Thermoplasmata archaeon]|nr:hypothetical protein [Thermoplasmata archaeon]
MSTPTDSSPVGAGLRPTSYVAGWSGINYSMCQCQPEDPSVAAGPSDVVEETTYQFYVYDKVGTVLFHESLAKFFGVGTNSTVMPRILYDNLTGRWFTTAVVQTRPYSLEDNLTLAVSTTSDPTGTWHIYGPFAPARHQYPWYPSIGVSRWMVGIGVDDFNQTTYAEYSQLFVFNKTEMMAGTTPAYFSWGVQNGYPLAPDFVATTSLGPSAHQYFSTILRTGSYVIWNVTGAPPASPSVAASVASLIYSATVPVPSAQPGFSPVVQAGSGGIISSYEQRGLVSSSWSAYDGKFDVIRVTQVWVSNATLRQDLIVHSGTANFLFPALGLDSRGDLTILVGICSTSLFPGLFMVGQVFNEPYTISNGYGFVIAGNSLAKNPNWGYYFGAGTDPTSSVIWMVGDYMSTTDYWGSSYVVGLETDPISVSLKTSAVTIDQGQSVTFTATSAGGTGLFNYNWTSLPPGCMNADRSSVTCMPSSAGAFSIGVTARDAFPRSASTSIALTVHPAPTLAAPTASKPGADVGQTVTFTSAPAAGGTPAYTYLWSGLPTGCGNANASSVVCTFTTGGALNLTVTAIDSLNVTAKSSTVSYTVSPALVVPAPTSTPASANTGTKFTFSVTPSRGSGGDQYAWVGLPSGCASSNAAFIICIPTAAGMFNVSVAVTDSNGATV